VLFLALDTATDQGSLALLEDDQVQGELTLDTPGSFLVHLLPALDTLLAQTRRRLSEVGAIGVSQGPGNFTGLRLGLATAQGLALSLAIPVVPVPTLEVVAAPWAGNPHPVAAVMDAKRGEVYLGRFDCRGKFPEPLGAPERMAAADLPARLEPPLLLTGPGLRPYQELLVEALAPGILIAPEESWYPRAATVGRVGRRRLARGLTVPPLQLTPLYLRPAL
jgi:tRNA threonylcarbamoyladenosine biosynthesis protein TsaB